MTRDPDHPASGSPDAAPDLQDAVLALDAVVDGAEPIAERTLRAVAHAGAWAEQRAAWHALLHPTIPG